MKIIESVSISELLSRLKEADRWAQNALDLDDLAFSLRSEILKPNENIWGYQTNMKFVESEVNKLVTRRRDRLDTTTKNVKQELKGRILCFYPWISLKDAVASVASYGYIDEEDFPPWDTWICYAQGEHHRRLKDKEGACLYAWVPEEVIEKVELAISEDTYDCLVWAKRLEKELRIRKQ